MQNPEEPLSEEASTSQMDIRGALVSSLVHNDVFRGRGLLFMDITSCSECDTRPFAVVQIDGCCTNLHITYIGIIVGIFHR